MVFGFGKLVKGDRGRYKINDHYMDVVRYAIFPPVQYGVLIG